ncbi:MAG: Hsp20/alpha crystallin family protein, partial [Acidobacteriota bacterium]
AYGQFVRAFTLSQNIDQEQIRADYRQGVLTITMPKRNETQTKDIKVETE